MICIFLTDGDDLAESKPITEPETSAADIDERVPQEAAGKFICDSSYLPYYAYILRYYITCISANL